MRIVKLICPGCGAPIDADIDNTTATCDFCGSSLFIDDETQRIHLDDAEQLGYDFEKGRQRAQAETIQTPPTQPVPHKRRTWLWVLGWIFCFPIPLTVLMFNNPRTKDWNIVLRIVITIAGWLLYLGLTFAGGGSSNNTKYDKSTNNSNDAALVVNTNNVNNTNSNINATSNTNINSNVNSNVNNSSATSNVNIGININIGTDTTDDNAASTPPQEVTLPDFRGQRLDEAYTTLKDLGMRCSYISDNGKTVIVKGNWSVIAQEPQPNAVVFTDQPVRLTVSKDPDAVANATSGQPQEVQRVY